MCYTFCMISDPAMLLSYVNTKLRDVYSTLSALCEGEELDEEELERALLSAGYRYDPQSNRFVNL